MQKSTFNVDLKLGIHASELFKERYHIFNSQFQRALKGEIIKYNSNYNLPGNRRFCLNVILQPIYHEGQLIAIANIAVDVTELAEKEKSSKKLNKDLILQNQQLYQYSHIISHNLRSPIATLMGIVNVIEEFEDDRNLTRQLLGHIKGTALKLDTIIKDLNHILNQTTQEPTFKQPIDMMELMNNIIELMGVSKDKGVEISCDFSAVPQFFFNKRVHTQHSLQPGVQFCEI